MSAAVVLAAGLATLPADALVTVNPITLAAPQRSRPLQVRVTAPLRGGRLPVVVFSHGDRFSKDDYLTLTEYWAAHGFVVVQPTHLDSRALGLDPADPARADNWRVRAQDVRRAIDALPSLEAQVPSLRGRVDPSRIIVAGHSYGGYTAGTLIGVQPTDPATGTLTDLADDRVLGAIMIAAPGGGDGGKDLAPAWRARGAYLNVDWRGMRRPALVIAGNQDQSAISARDWTWQTDAYRLSPAGGKCLLVVDGVKHYLGGVLGQNRVEAGEPVPEAVALVQRASLAFMQSLAGSGSAWTAERAALVRKPRRVAEFECR